MERGLRLGIIVASTDTLTRWHAFGMPIDFQL